MKQDLRQAEIDFVRTKSAGSKMPEITFVFWIIKVLTTGMGETTSDFLVTTIEPMVAVVLGGTAFAVSLVLQLSIRRYISWIYWLTVIMVSVFGTMAADVVHVALGIPYAVSSLFFGIVLILILTVWRRREGTLSIHTIHSLRRELFYWATVSTTFSLGTAVGDLTATTLGLGYFKSGVLFAIVIAVPALAHWKLKLPEIPAFWFAYILTRPLGASLADWLGVTHNRGGQDWGTGYVSLVLVILTFCCITFSTLTTGDAKRPSTSLLRQL